MSVQKIYDETIKPLPVVEQLRLATPILNHITLAESGIDESDEWSEEDFRDFSAASWQYINEELEKIENG